MDAVPSTTEYPEREPGRRGFAAAMYAVFAFVFVYLIGSFLDIFLLPPMEPWWMSWFAVGFAPAVAAFAAAAAALLSALRRRSPSLGAFRAAGREFWTGGRPAVVWCVWVILAALIAWREGISNLVVNGVYVFDIMVSLLLLYPLGVCLGRRGRRELLHLIMDVSMVTLFLLILYVYYRFFRGTFRFTLSGRGYEFSNHRLRLGSNANVGGSHCALMALCAVYRFGAVKNRAARLAFFVMGLVCASATVLTQSWASLLSLGLGITMALCLLVFRRSKLRGPKRFFLALGAGILFVGTLAAAFLAVTRILPSILPDFKARSLSLDKLVNLSGRTRIWKATVREFFRDGHLMLHGCSAQSVTQFLKEWTGTAFHTHNQFLEIMLSQGIPGLLFFLFLLGTLARRSVPVCADADTPRAGWLLPMLLLSLLLGNLLEPFLLGRQYFVGSMFFLIGGYVSGLYLSLREGKIS